MADDSDTGSTERRQRRTAAGAHPHRAHRHQLARVGAPCRQGRPGGAAQAQGLRHAAQGLSGLVNERSVRLLLLGSAVRADERNFARLHRLLADVGAVLDAEDLPELYVRASPMFNAYTIGMNTPIIVVDSGLVDLLDDDEEMRFLLGHELGHALSGHAVYQHPPAPPARPDRGPVRRPGRRPGRARHHRRADGVVAQGGAVGRPCRPARRPEPGRGHPGAHEARLRRQPRRPRRHLVLRAGQRVHRDRGPPRLRPQALPGRDPEPPVRGRPGRRAAPVDRVGGVHRDPRRHLPAPRGRRHRQGQRRRAGGRRQLQRGLPAHPGRPGQPAARRRRLPGTGPDLARRAVPPAAAREQ